MDKPSSGPWLGIDFGTCRTRASLLLGGVLRQVAVTTGYGSNRDIHDMPTAVYIEPNGDVLSGERAVNARYKDPSRLIRQFKLQIGDGRGVALPVDGVDRHYSWPELVAAVLSSVRQLAERDFNNNQPLTRAVLTVPAAYTPEGVPWVVMKEAARLAGFEEALIVREPHAAAIFYNYLLKEGRLESGSEGEITLVYDLGGGTFDPALIRRSGQTYEILGAQAEIGIHCGGTFFDQEIYKNFQQTCPEAVPAVEPLGRTADGAIVPEDAPKAARYARDLTSLEEFLVGVKHRFSHPNLEYVEEIVPPLMNSLYRLTRKDLDAILRPMVLRTVDCCDSLMQRSGVAWNELSRVLLVGGSCHLPLIQDELRSAAEKHGASGLPICWKRINGTDRILDPSFAVCFGAALAPELAYLGQSGRVEGNGQPTSSVISNRIDYRVERDIFAPFTRQDNNKKEAK